MTPLLWPLWCRAQPGSFSRTVTMADGSSRGHPLGDGEPDDTATDDGDPAAPAHRPGCAAMIRAYSRPESLMVRRWVA